MERQPDARLAAVQARLRRINGPEDLRLMLEPGAEQEIGDLTGLLAGQNNFSYPMNFQVQALLGWLHWYRHLALRSDRIRSDQDAEDFRIAVKMFVLVFVGTPDSSLVPESLLPFVVEGVGLFAVDLLQRALDSWDPGLLDAVVDLWKRIVAAVPVGHPHHATGLSNLGAALRTRFERSGASQDLDEAIDAMRTAAEAIPAGDSNHATGLSNLGAALNSRFGHSGSLEDLDESIVVGREAVAEIPADHPERAVILSNLGAALNSRFGRSGMLEYLSEAIDVGRSAIAATPVSRPSRAMQLSNLGLALRARFRHSGALQDIDEAVDVGRQAAAAIPADHPERAVILSNLVAALQARFDRTSALEDLDAAVKASRAAVDAAPADHPDRAGYQSNLGLALRARFERSEVLADINEAVAVGREAAAAIPDNHPDRAAIQSNLALALRTRFGLSGGLEDLDAAVKADRAAVDAAPADHPDRAGYQLNLGLALRARFDHSGAGADKRHAVAQFVSAVRMQFATPSIRVRAAQEAAELAGGDDPQGMAQALEIAVGLLPELAARHLARGDQQYALGGSTGLASDAAALALSDPSRPEDQRAAHALALLEAGRAVLLSQVMNTRSDLTDLQQQYPELAQRYTELRDLLDQPPASTTGTTDPVTGSVDRLALNNQFNAVLDQIHSHPGFETFAGLPSTHDLLTNAAAGPVVTFNVSVYRSDALLLTSDGVATVNLPHLGIKILTEKVNAFHHALDVAGDRRVSPSERIAAQAVLRDVLGWLWGAAAEPVLDALGYRQPPSAEAWPRIWWATGGMLGLLPLHAAGHHDPASAGQAVIDRVISSYTPTIRALHYARQHAAHTLQADMARPDHSLIVAMPTTPNQQALPYAAEEAKRLTACLPAPLLLSEPDPNPASNSAKPGPETPTRDAVLRQLQHCAVAHFACHGTHDTADPSHSHLLLHDYADSPLTIASLGPVRLERAQLAYLSACRTAFHGTVLLDEAIHLTAAFQLAGFPHVIGTLWEIYDQIAVTIADTFYTRLRADPDNPDLDYARAAQALHHAVRALRDQFPNLPALWAAYLHAGA